MDERTFTFQPNDELANGKMQTIKFNDQFGLEAVMVKPKKNPKPKLILCPSK